jgi:hypothetical protein
MTQSKRDRRLGQIKAVEREYLVAVTAVNALQAALRKNPSLLKKVLVGLADYRNLLENLQKTFLVRLFAEFETGLREVWVKQAKKKAEVPVRDVITSLGAKQDVPETVRENVHAVRRYRNALVHAGDDKAPSLPLDHARSYLCTFFSRMPETW